MIAAHSSDAWADKAGRRMSRGGDGATPAEQLADAEEEVEVLRAELLQEREVVVREIRALRTGWEASEARAVELEQQLVYLRCSEEVLSAELTYAEERASWWVGQHQEAKGEASQMQMALQGYKNRVASLGDELDQERTHVRELQAALRMHEHGREYQRRRLQENVDAKEKAEAAFAFRMRDGEEQRRAEHEAHIERVGAVEAKIDALRDRLNRSRLDVVEWEKAESAFSKLQDLLNQEVRDSKAFAMRQQLVVENDLAAERAAHAAELEGMQHVVDDVQRERTNFVESMKAVGDELYMRKLQESNTELLSVRAQLASTEALAQAKEEWAREQLDRLKEAFRADVHGMAARLDELRKTNVKLQVDARVNSRLVARQNQGLRKQLSLVAVRTTHVRYKLVAFLGWRFVVRWRKSEDTGVEQVRFEREEKESMVEYLEKKIKESRKASEARLKAQRASHKTKLGHTEQQLEETREALGRLKSFSAAKLRSLSEELEAMRDDQGNLRGTRDSAEKLRSLSQQLSARVVGAASAAAPAPAEVEEDAPAAAGRYAAAFHAAAESRAAAAARSRAATCACVPSAAAAAADGLTAVGAPSFASAVPREGPGAAAEKAAALRASVKLDVRAAQLLTLEQRLYEASNLNHKLERRLKRADGARKELKELKKAHEALAAMDNARAMEADLAAKRIAELEGRQRALDAAAAADAEGGGGDASAEVAALRAQVAAIRHGFVERAVKKWQRGTTEAVWRAWREHTHRSQLERAANRLAERPPADWGEEEAEQDNRVAGSEYYYYSERRTRRRSRACRRRRRPRRGWWRRSRRRRRRRWWRRRRRHWRRPRWTGGWRRGGRRRWRGSGPRWATRGTRRRRRAE